MDKLSFKLPAFEGPLDLLLHLISKNKLNIYDIPVAELVDQYIEHINMIKDQNMDIASEFLEMAARLVYIKTVTLLPKHEEAEELKAELTGELIEYQTCRQIAATLSTMTEGFKTVVREPVKVEFDKAYKRHHSPDELLKYYAEAAGRGLRRLPPPATAFSGIVSKKIVSVSSKIIFVLRNLWNGKSVKFNSLFTKANSKSDIVATFIAVLELVKTKRVMTSEKDGEIMIKIDKAGSKRGNQQL